MSKIILLDGAMGTMLQDRGLTPGANPSVFGMENPLVLESVHNAYIKAGSRVILSNTFTANEDKLTGSGKNVKDVVAANVRIAKKCASRGGKNIKVALDIGPIGKLMDPYGELTFERAYEIFEEIIKAGDEAGADVIYFETMSSLNELRAGILAAKENSKLPIWATMSFEESGRTFIGCTAESMAVTLTALGVDALGVNCSLGPNELLPIIKKIRRFTDKPLIIKPNAGLPDPATGEYKLDAKSFGEQMKQFAKYGVFAMGGCCGTTPEFIEKLSALNLKTDYKKSNATSHGICSASSVKTFDKINIIGERINPTGKKKLAQALIDEDMNYIMSLAISQEEEGADILDINVGLPDIDEVKMMPKVVKAVQSVVSIPLQIDSSNAEAIEAGLRVYEGRAIVNSVDATNKKLKAILPIVKKYGAAVVGLTLEKGGVPNDADERVALAKKIFKKAKEFGIEKRDIIIDCLALTVSAQPEQAKETLKAMKKLHKKGAHLTLGVSNISFGLPNRDEVNKRFLKCALASGLNFPIINPSKEEMINAVDSSHNKESSYKKYFSKFMKAVKSGVSLPTNEKQVSDASNMTIEIAVRRGLGDEVKNITKEILTKKSELDIVNEILIPALDGVGRDYESGKIFLPQLINSANAACAGFDVIKESIAKRGGNGIEKGTIILATVEGDIHDIGKNIVKVVLENYGFKIVDLGKDVPPKTVVNETKKQGVKLVGLSALMTTTVPAMERTIELLKKECANVKVMVGGAVLTQSYADKIGADFYTKDATASVRVAEKIFGGDI